jgi:3',5'-cyclic AMP phosphodiesterase CpdA
MSAEKVDGNVDITVMGQSSVADKASPLCGCIWHMSDLHFDPDETPGDPDMKREPAAGGQAQWTTDWSRHLREYARRWRADVLVFSGDFANATSVAEADKRDAEAAAPVKESAVARFLIDLGLKRPARQSETPNSARRKKTASGKETTRRGQKRIQKTLQQSATPTSSSFVSSAKRRAFSQARKFILELAEAHDLADAIDKRVVVCAGNQDVTWPSEDSKKDLGSFEEFNDAFEGFLRSGIKNPAASIPEKGLAIITLNTAYLGGVEFTKKGAGTKTREDAASFSMQEIRKALKSLCKSWGGRTDDTVPSGLFGVVVAHHPPSIIPTPNTEVKPYETSIGAAQAKQSLYEAGMRLFLHGHKHVEVAQRESVYKSSFREPRILAVVGATSLFGRDNSTPGFNIIEYAVSPQCGGAWMLITPHSFAENYPHPEPPVRIAIPARVRSAARTVRVVDRISDLGDSRTDIYWHEVPVPSLDKEPMGWSRDGGRALRVFERKFRSPDCHIEGPLVESLVDGVTATTTEVQCAADGTHSWNITVTARPDVHRASFIERTFRAGAYAVSVNHQRRLWKGDVALPGLPSGYEYLVYLLRDPAERLELFIRLPFRTSEDLSVELRTYRRNENGSLEPAPEFQKFSDCLVEKALFAKRIRVAITKPVTGIGYAVVWRLPSVGPSEARLNPDEKARLTEAERQAEGLREAMVTLSEGDRKIEQARLKTHLAPVFAAIQSACPEVNEEDIEWALFVPNRRIFPLEAATTPGSSAQLTPQLGSFPAGSAHWTQMWKPGMGIAGRTYAIGKGTLYRADRGKTEVGWEDTEVDVYIRLPGQDRHTVLYGIPLLHPTRKEGDVVWGCLCIGTYKRFSRLSLDAMPSGGTEADLPSVVLYNQLIKFSTAFWEAASGRAEL